MGFLQHNFLKNIFIFLEHFGKFCFVNISTVVGNKTIKTEKKRFFYEVNHRLPEVMINYIYSFTKEYSQCYVSIVLYTSLQHTVVEKDITKSVRLAMKENNTSILIHNKWRIFTSVREVNVLMQRFKPISVDYVIAPVAILHYLYLQEPKGDNCIYLLATQYNITAFIIKNSVVVSSIGLSLLDDLDNKDVEEGLGIDSLDEVKSDSFEVDADSEKNILELEDEEYEIGDSETEKDIESASSNIQSFLSENITHVIDGFYDSKYYKSDDDLIVSMVIFNDDCIDVKMREYLKEFFMLDISHKNIHSKDIVLSMSKGMVWK